MDGSSNIESDMDLDNYDMDLEMDNAMDICSEIGESERISKVPKSEKKREASKNKTFWDLSLKQQKNRTNSIYQEFIKLSTQQDVRFDLMLAFFAKRYFDTPGNNADRHKAKLYGQMLHEKADYPRNSLNTVQGQNLKTTLCIGVQK